MTDLTNEEMESRIAEAYRSAPKLLRAQVYRSRATMLTSRATQAVERLGASPELTAVVVLLAQVRSAINDDLDERDRLAARVAELEAAEHSARREGWQEAESYLRSLAEPVEPGSQLPRRANAALAFAKAVHEHWVTMYGTGIGAPRGILYAPTARDAVANTASDQPVAPHVIRDSDGTVLSAYLGSVEWAVFKGHEGNGMAIISNCCDCRKPYLTWSVLSTMRCGDCRVTAARADERAQLAARATEQEREMVGQFGAINILCGVANAQGDTERARRAADEADRLSGTLLAALTAARERVIEEAAVLCDTALKTIPPKSDAAAEVLHLAGRIRALAGRKGES